MTLRLPSGQIEKHDDGGRGLDHPPGGHGHGLDDRWTVETGPASDRIRGRSCSPTVTASATWTSMPCWRFHRRHGPARHRYRRAPPARFGGMVFERRSGLGVHRKIADRRRLDQRRVHGARARRVPIPDGGRIGPRDRCRSSGSLSKGSWRRTATRVSGNVWTLCETSGCSTAIGRAGPRPGRLWA